MFVPLVQFVLGVVVITAHCPYQPNVSCYDPERNTIYIAQVHHGDEEVLMHEYGHAWDFQRMTFEQQYRFQRILRFPKGQGWWEARGDRDSPAETFAWAYSDCALGKQFRNRRVCALLPQNRRLTFGQLFTTLRSA